MLFYFLCFFILSIFLLFLSLLFIFKNIFIYFSFPILFSISSQMQISFIIDWMSLLFSFSVCFISSMIILFSKEYIPNKEIIRFLLILSIFILSMIILIFSNNLFFIILGWDGLGISSYILVIYYQNYKSCESGTITILSNRIGDIMIILSISILFSLGSWEFQFNNLFPYIILFFTLIAAFSKSAQVPFSAWLPSAMAAPTPVSALVHSSTLVTAGVYILIRMSSHFNSIILNFTLYISLITLISSSISALWEQDMKKIIALSTLSQIALMMFSISINSLNIAFFHLITHAFFKSTMFICAGTLIHSSNYQDSRKQNSLNFSSPLTFSILGISSLALMGIPFLAGFYSKDAIINSFFQNNLNIPISLLILLSLGMTSSYSTRMIKLISKNFIKSKPDFIFHPLSLSLISPSILLPMSIFSGSSLSWQISYSKMFFINPNLILFSFFMIFLGFLFSYSLSFKSFNFLTMGEASLSLWFLHFISSFSFIIPSKSSFNFSKLDKSWNEMSSAQGIFYYLNFSSKSSNFSILLLIPPLISLSLLLLI